MSTQSIQYVFSWEPALSVHHETLDSQHKQLLQCVNTLLEALANDQGNEASIRQTFSFLDQYIDKHFIDEEAYMQLHHYPYFKEHQALHREFTKQYALIKAKVLTFHTIDTTLLDLENHVARWWIEHIGKADKQYADFIQAHETLRSA